MFSNKTYEDIFKEKKCCVIIPTYNNDKTLGKVIESVLEYTLRIIIVNDGSTDLTKQLLQKYSELSVINFDENKGKGKALRAAFKHALNLGYQFAITMDADGQHYANDIPTIINTLNTNSQSIIIGSRNMDQDGVPGKSNFGMKFSNFWFWVDTGIKMEDTQSGYRLYSLNSISKLKLLTNRFEFEVEVIVRSAWSGVCFKSVPVKVKYFPEKERVSHFRPLQDFTRISILNTVLFICAIFYGRPRMFLRKLNKANVKKFIDKNFFFNTESNLKLSLSVALGVFLGVSPIWGYQMVVALFFAYIFKLNKLIVIAASNISIPPMIPLIITASIFTGEIILGVDNLMFRFSSESTFEFIKNNLLLYVVGSLSVGLILSLFFGLTTYLFLKLFRKKAISSLK